MRYGSFDDKRRLRRFVDRGSIARASLVKRKKRGFSRPSCCCCFWIFWPSLSFSNQRNLPQTFNGNHGRLLGG